VIANLGYMPAKTVYALTGAHGWPRVRVCTGGSYETASSIWTPSLGGTYALTPSMPAREEPIAFAGSAGSDRVVSEAPADEAPAPARVAAKRVCPPAEPRRAPGSFGWFRRRWTGAGRWFHHGLRVQSP